MIKRRLSIITLALLTLFVGCEDTTGTKLQSDKKDDKTDINIPGAQARINEIFTKDYHSKHKIKSEKWTPNKVYDSNLWYPNGLKEYRYASFYLHNKDWDNIYHFDTLGRLIKEDQITENSKQRTLIYTYYENHFEMRDYPAFEDTEIIPNGGYALIKKLSNNNITSYVRYDEYNRIDRDYTIGHDIVGNITNTLYKNHATGDTYREVLKYDSLNRVKYLQSFIDSYTTREWHDSIMVNLFYRNEKLSSINKYMLTQSPVISYSYQKDTNGDGLISMSDSVTKIFENSLAQIKWYEDGITVNAGSKGSLFINYAFVISYYSGYSLDVLFHELTNVYIEADKNKHLPNEDIINDLSYNKDGSVSRWKTVGKVSGQVYEDYNIKYTYFE